MDIDATTRSILLELRTRVEAGGDGGMYGNRSEALHDLDVLLANPSTWHIKRLLMPTANLQELAIECGWGSEFNKLAAELERVLDIV